mmetsp:Transcript_8493/g.24350  ORF Transcript_8493/g.24350 Transcript_8493/m.24350 type:complete len:201 (+) Transcript_8493:512-1114(+)
MTAPLWVGWGSWTICSVMRPGEKIGTGGLNIVELVEQSMCSVSRSVSTSAPLVNTILVAVIFAIRPSLTTCLIWRSFSTSDSQTVAARIFVGSMAGSTLAKIPTSSWLLHRSARSLAFKMAPCEVRPNIPPLPLILSRRIYQQSLDTTQRRRSSDTPFLRRYMMASMPVFPAPMTVYLRQGRSNRARALTGTVWAPPSMV